MRYVFYGKGNDPHADVMKRNVCCVAVGSFYVELKLITEYECE